MTVQSGSQPRLRRNPVVLKELRGRMRGARAFIVLTVYLVLMSAFTTLLYVILSSARDIFGNVSGGQIGRNLFIGIVAIEFFLVSFIAPSFTAGAISGERERQTYDLLRTTLLPARSLVVGKMISALAYILILLLAAIPLQSIAFLFGGVTEAEVILAFVMLASTALLLGSAGLYFSAIRERTLASNVLTYGLTLALTVGLPLLTFVIGAFVYQFVTNGGFSTLSIPVQVGLIVVAWILLSTNPVVAAVFTQLLLVREQTAGIYTLRLTTTSGIFSLPLVSPWIIFTILSVIVSILFMIATTRRINRIEN